MSAPKGALPRVCCWPDGFGVNAIAPRPPAPRHLAARPQPGAVAPLAMPGLLLRCPLTHYGNRSGVRRGTSNDGVLRARATARRSWHGLHGGRRRDERGDHRRRHRREDGSIPGQEAAAKRYTPFAATRHCRDMRPARPRPTPATATASATHRPRPRHRSQRLRPDAK